MSIKDTKITKDQRFTFIKTKNILITKCVWVAIFAALIVFPVEFTVFNLLLKIAFSIIFIVFAVMAAFVPRNGLYIYTTGKIKLVSGMSTLKLDLDELKRIAVNFTEWETGEFSANIKFVFEEGDAYTKDYAGKFHDTGNHLSLPSYTMPRATVDEYCKTLEEMNVCNISIIDINKDIVYQYIRK